MIARMDSKKPATLQTTPFHIDLADTPAFSTSYCGGAPSPILLAYGAGALHRVVQRHSDWNYEKILMEKDAKILRSDSRESASGEKTWEDIILDEGGGVFLHISEGCLAAYSGDRQTAEKAAHEFRERFAKKKSPSAGTYHLITHDNDCIGATEVRLAEGNILDSGDLDLFYGDGFSDWSGSYLGILAEKKGGLALLEGPPGTGKTSFLRHLMRQLKDSHRFYFIPPANVGMLSDPEFIGFWRKQRNIHKDLGFVCVLEDAGGALMVRDTDNRRQVAAILNLTDGLMSDFLRLHIVCSINCASTAIDPALIRPGRLQAHRVFSRVDASTAHRIAAKAGRELPLQSDYSLAEIFNADPMQRRETPRVGFAA
jgi:hypothetical protein